MRCSGVVVDIVVGVVSVVVVVCVCVRVHVCCVCVCVFVCVLRQLTSDSISLLCTISVLII